MRNIFFITLIYFMSLQTCRMEELTCRPCDTGSYLNNGVCVVCPENSNTRDGSPATTLSDCECQSGHYNILDSCHECDIGKFKVRLADETCETCHGNSTTLSNGTIEAAQCFCEGGFYSNTPLSCQPCPKGTYSSQISNENCEPCPADKYCPLGTQHPIPCPLNSTLIGSGEQKSDCQCEAGFSYDQNQDCQLCEAGKFQSLTNQQDCIECVHGTYRTTTGAKHESDCLPCDINSYTDTTGSSELTDCKCNAGYSGEDGYDCLPCEPGSFRPLNNVYICTECGAGTYNEFYASNNVSSCNQCPQNTSTDGATGSPDALSCTCNAGFESYHATNALFYVCTSCDAGHYQPLKNSSACIGCNTGKYSTTIGAVDSGTCLECQDGTYSIEEGQSACLSCPNNRWQDPTNPALKSQECTVCPLHMTHALTEVTDVNLCECTAGRVGTGINNSYTCSLCAAGHYCPGNRRQIACEDNTWIGSGVNSNSCNECHQNSQIQDGSDRSNVTECQCKPGMYGSYDDNCLPCLKGTYRLSFGNHESAICIQCDGGKYSDNLGSTECKACPFNSTSPSASEELLDCVCDPGFQGNAVDTCTICQENHFCTGGEVQNICKPHSRSNNGSKFESDCKCIPGYFLNSTDSLCHACPVNTYCSGDTEFEQCPSNSFTNALSFELNSCVCIPGFWRGCVLNAQKHYVYRNGTNCTLDFSLACVSCEDDEICIDGDLSHCPANSFSIGATSDGEDCVCEPGYRYQTSFGSY